MIKPAEQPRRTRWVSNILISQDEWQIYLCVGESDSESQARALLRSVEEASVHQEDQQSAICVSFERQVRFFTDKDLTIDVLKPSALSRLGPPLDITDPKNKQKALQAGIEQDPAYCVNDLDFHPSKLTIADLIARYGDNVKLDILSEGVHPIVN